MCFNFWRSKGKKFECPRIGDEKINDKPKYELITIYEKCIDEMTLQQAKRDQIITVYVAMFSFVVSYILSSEQLNFFTKGLVFLAIALIGFGFSLIITRYRMYKEAYWICCEAITNLMSIKEGEIDKEVIQGVYYRCLYKKGKTYLSKKKRFRYWKFFCKNIFSGETIYCLIHSFIASALLGLSIFLITYSTEYNSLLAAVVSGLVSFVWQVYIYFKNLMNIYRVLVDGKDDSFNKVFAKAWFLHLYVEKEEATDENNSEIVILK